MRLLISATARHRLIATSLVVTALTLTACGDDDDAASATTAPAAATAGGPSTSAVARDFNDADVEFVQTMIAHHQQAVEMAEAAEVPARGASPEVLDLAARIKAAQTPEIQTMMGWLNDWGQPAQMDQSGGHDMSSDSAMMSTEDMNAVMAATGPAFDDMWLNMMIEHHQGAIAMATQIQQDGFNADVKALASDIVTAQQAEVEEMNRLLQA